ncbi:glycosyltransferase [Vibrio breoganii]
MKIMLITEQVHKIGGIEKVLSLKIRYWTDSKYDVCLVTTENNNQEPFFSIPKSLIWKDLEVKYNRTKRLTSLKNLIRACKHFYSLKSVIVQEKPDVIVNCCYGYDTYFLPFVKGKAKIIQEMHSSNLYTVRGESVVNTLKSKVRTFFENKFDAIVTLSEEERLSYKSNNSYVIPNPIDFSVQRKKIDKKNIVLSAGRLVPVKGFDRLIKIWGDYIGNDSCWELHIYGDSDDNEYKNLLQSLIKEHSLESSVKIFPPSNNLLEIMSACKIYALPSRSECFPMVILESLSVGLPVVSFDCPTGPRNIILNEKTGFLVKDNDSKEFSDTLLSLMNDDILLNDIGESAFSQGKMYSIPEIMIKWDKLFYTIRCK